MAGIGPSGEALDVSGLGNHLSMTGTPDFEYSGIAPNCHYSGIGQWHSITDAASSNAFDIIGNETYSSAAFRGLSLGAWVWFDDSASINEHIIAKWDIAGNQRAYRLLRTAAGVLQAETSGNGIASTAATGTTTVTQDTWHHVALTHDPGTLISVYLDGTLEDTTAAPALTIHDSTAPFTIAADSSGAAPLDGRLSLVWISTLLLSAVNIRCHREATRAVYNVR
jgi:hypothetical protein